MVLKITKTKVNAEENCEVTIPFLFGEGPRNKHQVIQSAINNGVITRDGQSFVFGDKSIRGKDKFFEWAVTEGYDAIKTAIESKIYGAQND